MVDFELFRQCGISCFLFHVVIACYLFAIPLWYISRQVVHIVIALLLNQLFPAQCLVDHTFHFVWVFFLCPLYCAFCFDLRLLTTSL